IGCLPFAHLVLNFRVPAPPSPRGVLAYATPKRLPFRLRRLAVTEEQIEEWSLPTRPTKRSDSRARSFGSSVSVELAAIDPRRLRSLVERAIRKHMPKKRYERVDGAGGARAPADREAGGRARHRGTGRGETMKIIGGTDKDKEDEARKRADALAKAIIKMLPQHLSHRELLAALSSVLAAAFAEDGTREGVLRGMRDLTASVLADFGALKRRQRLGQRHIPEEDGDDPA